MKEQAKKEQAKRKNRVERIRQEKYKRRELKVKRAKKEPKAAPTARGYLIQEIWNKLRLDEALEKVGIEKEGIPLSTIFLVVLLMGIIGASSLYQLVELVPQDAALWVMLGIESLEEKQLYRGLGRVTVKQYQAWMGEMIKGLQRDERTKSIADGVVIGDTSQVVKKWAKKIPMVQVLWVHSEKVFAKGVEIVNTHYADEKKDYPLFMAFYEPSEERKAEQEEKKKEKKAGVDRRKPETVLA